MTEASRSLVALAKRIAAAYVAQTGPRAILLTGSAAEGISDAFSDLDLIAYYDRLSSPEQLAAARASLQATNSRTLSSHETESSIEEYLLQGVECQMAHLTIPAWERDMASVLEDFELGTHVEKAITGLRGFAMPASILQANRTNSCRAVAYGSDFFNRLFSSAVWSGERRSRCRAQRLLLLPSLGTVDHGRCGDVTFPAARIVTTVTSRSDEG